MSVCVSAMPTAQTSFDETAATPESQLPAPALGLGLGTTLQLLPSQWSISGVPPLCPTAQTSFAEMAVTSSSSFPPPKFWLGTTLQLLPSQCSISGYSVLLESS